MRPVTAMSWLHDGYAATYKAPRCYGIPWDNCLLKPCDVLSFALSDSQTGTTIPSLYTGLPRLEGQGLATVILVLGFRVVRLNMQGLGM